MAILTRQSILPAGLDAVFSAAAAAGDQMVNDDRTVLAVKTQTNTTVVTIAKVRNVSKEGYGTVIVPNIIVTCAPNKTYFIGAPPAAYNAGDRVSITYDQVTGTTVAALVRPQD